MKQLLESWTTCFAEWYSQLSYPTTKMDAISNPTYFWNCLEHYCGSNFIVHTTEEEGENFESIKTSLKNFGLTLVDISEDLYDKYGR